MYVPVPPLEWKAVHPENWFHLPIDTIYIQGLEPQIHTQLILDEFVRHGAITSIVRHVHWEEKEKRQCMWIQYETWRSAWHAVKESHGKMLEGQDIAVEIPNMTFRQECWKRICLFMTKSTTITITDEKLESRKV